VATETKFIDIYAIVIKLEDYGLLNSIIILSSITMTVINNNKKNNDSNSYFALETLSSDSVTVLFFNLESMLISWISPS